MDELNEKILRALSNQSLLKLKVVALKRDIKYGLSCGLSFVEAFDQLDEDPGWEYYGIEYPQQFQS